MHIYARCFAVLLFSLNYALDFFICLGGFHIPFESESLSTTFYISVIIDMVLSAVALVNLLRSSLFHWHCGTFGLLKTVSPPSNAMNMFTILHKECLFLARRIYFHHTNCKVLLAPKARSNVNSDLDGGGDKISRFLRDKEYELRQGDSGGASSTRYSRSTSRYAGRRAVYPVRTAFDSILCQLYAPFEKKHAQL